MKILLINAINPNKEIESRVYGHFGSAHYFVVVDTEENSTEMIKNPDRDHLHGHCQMAPDSVGGFHEETRPGNAPGLHAVPGARAVHEVRHDNGGRYAGSP